MSQKMQLLSVMTTSVNIPPPAVAAWFPLNVQFISRVVLPTL